MISLDDARKDPRWETASLVDTRLGRMHAVVRGEGPDVLLIHGVTDNATTWRDIQAELTGVRSHAIDLPGHGLTDIPAEVPAPRDLGEWAQAYLEAAGVERAVVVGWSLGGTTALTLAAAHPGRVRALVLVGAAALDFPRAPGLKLLEFPFVGELMPRIGRANGLRRVAMRDTYARGFRPTDAILDRYFLGWQVEGRARFIRELLRSLELGPVGRVLPEIEAPAWIVHGEEDRLVPVRIGREIGARLRRAEAKILARVGHAPHIERPESVLDAIRAALG